jgi:transcriptional regulator with XRE-family HTH domain
MPSQVDGKFAARLRALQFEQRLSVEALSRQTGISVRLLAKYRAGTTEPRDYYGDPSANAYKLADALEVAVEDLLPPEPNGDPVEAAA